MKNLFALIGFGTIAFVGLGWYLGWYNVSRQPGAPGTQRFSFEVIPSKVSTDVKKGAERVGEIYEKLTEETPSAETPKDEAKAPTAPVNANAAPLTATAGPRWLSLELAPPPPLNTTQPITALPPRR
jgi:hypothetical protein